MLAVKKQLRRQMSKDKCDHTYQSLFLPINASVFGAVRHKQTSQRPCFDLNEDLFLQQIAFSLMSPKKIGCCLALFKSLVYHTEYVSACMCVF